MRRIFYYKTAQSQTGSYPNPPPGRQRDMRFIPIITPLIAPYFSMACFMYSLQVGVNLQTFRPPITGEMNF
jgi:hypothetical protein